MASLLAKTDLNPRVPAVPWALVGCHGGLLARHWTLQMCHEHIKVAY